MKVHVGLGALSNKHFDNSLFPLRTPHDEYIPRYAERLGMLELDALHYRPEWTESLQQWLRQAPKGFRFLPKMWKNATHPENGVWDDEQLDAARHALDCLSPLLESDHAGPVVVQFPPSFSRSEQRQAWLDNLLDLEAPGRFALEFRHQSWAEEDIETFLAERKTTMIWSTHKGAPDVTWATGNVGVVRLAGSNYPDKSSRGRPVTKADRLEDILALRAKLASAPWKECFVAVLNPFEGNAVDSLPRVAGALVDPELGRRLTRKPGEPLFRHPPGSPAQLGLNSFDTS